MKLLGKLALYAVALLLLAIVAFDIWGYATLGTLQPAIGEPRDPNANRVVLVSGATGSVGDGLLKAAMEDPQVEKIYALSRRSSPRIQAGVESGRVELILHKDFTDYSDLADVLAEVNTVLWGLGTSSLNVDDDTYTWIHVDFPVAFVNEWLSARTEAPMSFHYVTGVGTDANGDSHWAREKGRAEIEVAEMAHERRVAPRSKWRKWHRARGCAHSATAQPLSSPPPTGQILVMICWQRYLDPACWSSIRKTWAPPCSKSVPAPANWKTAQ
jgi:hypothetical protein